jgi:hypothetical protein
MDFGNKAHLIQPDRPQLASHHRLLVQSSLLPASGGGLIRALGCFEVAKV